MEKYILRVTYEKNGSYHALSIATEALTDDEALRSAHPVADLAEWDGATNLKVSVSSRDGRMVGIIGDDDTDASLFERQTTHADTYRKG